MEFAGLFIHREASGNEAPTMDCCAAIVVLSASYLQLLDVSDAHAPSSLRVRPRRLASWGHPDPCCACGLASSSASPGVIATILLFAHYGSHEQYVMALAREMRKEY